MGELVSQAEYARRKGVSRQAIHELVKRGVIPLADGKIDPAIADSKIGEHLDPGRAKTLGEGEDDEPRDGAPASAGMSEYQRAKIHRETFEGKLAELEYQKAAGAVLDRIGAERGVMEAARMLRDTVLNVPRRIAADAAAMTDARLIEQLMTTELRQALDDFAKVAQRKLAHAAS